MVTETKDTRQRGATARRGWGLNVHVQVKKIPRRHVACEQPSLFLQLIRIALLFHAVDGGSTGRVSPAQPNQTSCAAEH